MQLLLIDNRINDIETIIGSINDTTCCVVFNYYHDTIDTIISKIRFLNRRNRVIRDNFYYEVPPVPVITDLSNCLLCDEHGVPKQYLSASDIAERALGHAVSYLNHSNNDVPPTPWTVPSNEGVPVSVFFQRNDTVSITIDGEITNTYVKPLPVLVDDLDDIYEVFKTIPYESFPYIYQVDDSDNTVPTSVPYTQFSTIGIIQHTYLMNGSDTYKFINAMNPAILSDVKLNDLSLDTWRPFINFIQAILVRHQVHTLDLMACALYSDNNWKYVIDELQTRLEINIRASLDNTGAALMGGNWILETDDANLKDVYFTDAINGWNHLLATITDSRFYALRWNNSMYLTYPGSSTAVNVGTGDFTFETWYYETSRQTNCTIFDKGNYNYTWQIRNQNISGNGLSFYNNNTGWLYAESAAVPEGQWSHLAITRSGSTFKFYINGTLMQTMTNSTTLNNNGSNFGIGIQSPDSCSCNRMKTGCRLYDARMWNVCRTDNEIKLNRNRIVPSNSTGLVANYLLTFDSSTSATAATSISDRTSNAINLNFVNYTNTWSNDVPVPNVGFYIANSYLQDVITEPSNLVARYNFDISAVTIDSSPNNNTLTNVSSVSFNTTEYKHGTSSATFNGSNYFQITNDGRFSPDNFTIAFWIRPKATSGLHQALASSRGTDGSGWFIYIAPNNNLEFFTGPGPTGAWNGGSVYTNFGGVFQDIWVHIAIVMNKSSSSFILYLNGASVLSTTRTYVNNTGTNMRIGAGANESAADFIVRNGTLMDDFRFYNKVLTSSEVIAISRVATKFAVNYGDLTYTDFSGVNFSGLNFTGTTLTGSNFTNCNFTNATLVNVTVDSSTNFTGANFTNLTSSGIVGTPILSSAQYMMSSGSIVSTLPAPNIGSLAIIPTKTFGTDVSFNLIDPSSNSTGAFTYSSSNTSVATVASRTVTITGVGTSTITATQLSDGIYRSASVTTILTVNAALPTFGPFTLGPKLGSYVLADASFSLTAPSSNSAGTFSYTSDNSAVAIVSLPSNLGYTTTNLLARYDASLTTSYTLSGSVVTQWNDLTGNGYHLTQNGTGPTLSSINNIQAMEFNSNRGLIRSNVPLNTDVTIFMVIRYSSLIGSWGNFMHHGDHDYDWSMRKSDWSSPSGKVGFHTNNDNYTVMTSLVDGMAYILIGRLNVNGNIDYWAYPQTGNVFSLRNVSMSKTITSGNKTVYVGKSDVNEPCNGRIGEILYYNRAISDVDISSNYLYLQNKWFNGNNTISTTPYVSLVANGTANISATQDACGNYLSKSVSSLLTVGGSQIASTFASSTFTVASSKTMADSSFVITTRPTSNSDGLITYSSSNTNVATIDPSGNFITPVGIGDVSFNATQAATVQYLSSIKTSNNLTVSKATPVYQPISQVTKTVADVSFSLSAIMAGVSTSNGAYTFSGPTTISATILSTDNLNNISAANFSGGQYQSNLKVGFAANLAGWNKEGGNAIHIVDIANTVGQTNTPNYVIMFWADNIITQSTAVAGTNTNGNLYTVSFKAGPATYQIAGQSTQANSSDGIIFDILRSDNTVLATSTYLPGAWAGYPTLTTSSFTYTGDGTGNIRIRIKTVSTTNGRFGGCVDDVVISGPSTVAQYVSISGDVATILGYTPSPVTIAVSQAATATYSAGSTTFSLFISSNNIPNLSSSTFTVASTKTFGDVSFAITTRPTSNSDGLITYSSSNANVATIDPSGIFITLVGAGDVSFNATQAATAQYTSATKTSNTLTVARGTSTLSAASFSVPSSKTFGNAPFSFDTLPTSNNTSVAIVYSSSNMSVATVDASGTTITLVGAGDVSFNATQAQTNQYNAATKASNTLTVSRGTSTLSAASFQVASSKTIIDASFTIDTKPTSNNTSVAIVYSSSNTDVATIDPSGIVITIVGLGDVSFNATQSQTNQYNAAAKTSNTLTVNKAMPTLAFANPPTTKNVTDPPFSVVASSASSGAVTYSSNNTAVATVDASTGLVTLKSAGTVTVTASQASAALYESPPNSTCSIVVSSAGTALQGQTVSSSTSFASVDLSGASLAGTTVSGVSFSGANLSNVNFSGAVITNTNFSNANISGATNLPAFSTVQKLQLLKNINNVEIGAVQVTAPVSGSDINTFLATPRSDVAEATFTIKAPATVDSSNNKVVTVTTDDISGGKSIYIPMNANENIKLNDGVYSFNGTNLVNSNGTVINYLFLQGRTFKVYAGSVVAVNVAMQDELNKIKVLGDGLYSVLSQLFYLNGE